MKRRKRIALLNIRQTTHGDFAKNAQVSQAIKDIIEAAGGNDLAPVHREALDMIALKISRIVSGKADMKDHWADIAGYANLGAEVCDA